MNASSILTPDTDLLLKASKKDAVTATLLKDITTYILADDYRRAAQAAAYLLAHLAKQSAQKPFTLLRKAK